MAGDSSSEGRPSFSSYQVFALASNIVSVVVLAVLFLLLEVAVEPFKRGFFCDDLSIAKPYGDEKISTALACVLSLFFILLVVIVTDCTNRFLPDATDEEPGPVAKKLRLKQWIYLVISRVCLGLVGLAFCLILINISKLMVGRLRPHFLAVCKPNLANCTAGVFMDFSACTGTNTKALKEARKSFPSGHAGAAAYASIFFALYIEYAVRPKAFTLLKPLTQFFIFFCGVAVALTRISDYFHHWSDVLAGFILGGIFAYYAIFSLLELPKQCAEKEKACKVDPMAMQANNGYNATDTMSPLSP